MGKVIVSKTFEPVEYSSNGVSNYTDKMGEVFDFFKRPDLGMWKANHVVSLEFSEPINLFYGLRYSSRKEDTKHTVKQLFISGGRLCYTAGRMKTRGHIVDSTFYQNLIKVEVIETVEDYSKEWASIANSMRKHNINLDVADDIDAHLAGEAEYIKGFQNYWKKTDKPRRMSFKDVLDFNSATLERMKKQLADGDYITHYKSAKQPWSRKGRDRSIYISKKGDTFRYMSASEFPNCGNGDYYCMYSPAMAFYAESD